MGAVSASEKFKPLQSAGPGWTFEEIFQGPPPFSEPLATLRADLRQYVTPSDWSGNINPIFDGFLAEKIKTSGYSNTTQDTLIKGSLKFTRAIRHIETKQLTPVAPDAMPGMALTYLGELVIIEKLGIRHPVTAGIYHEAELYRRIITDKSLHRNLVLSDINVVLMRDRVDPVKALGDYADLLKCLHEEHKGSPYVNDAKINVLVRNSAQGQERQAVQGYIDRLAEHLPKYPGEEALVRKACEATTTPVDEMMKMLRVRSRGRRVGESKKQPEAEAASAADASDEDLPAVRPEKAGDWILRAACRGPQGVVFFPPSHFERKSAKLEREALAKAICATCPVREPCLEYALRTREPHGILGGLTEEERGGLWT